MNDGRRNGTVRLDFKNGICSLFVKNDSTSYQLGFGSGKWIMDETKKLGPALTARLRGNRSEIPSYKIAGSYHWKTDSTLELVLRYIESPHTERIRCTFEGDKLNIEFESSYNKSVTSTMKGSANKVQGTRAKGQVTSQH